MLILDSCRYDLLNLSINIDGSKYQPIYQISAEKSPTQHGRLIMSWLDFSQTGRLYIFGLKFESNNPKNIISPPSPDSPLYPNFVVKNFSLSLSPLDFHWLITNRGCLTSISSIKVISSPMRLVLGSGEGFSTIRCLFFLKLAFRF